MELDYTYFEAEDGFFVGWFDNFPEDVTQGRSLEELEEMLTDMYRCLNLAKSRYLSFHSLTIFFFLSSL